jgi:predicted ester cyclase
MNLHKDRVWQLVDEGYNRGRAAVAHEVCHPDYVNESVIRAMPRGPDGAALHIDLSHAAIADIQVRIVDLVGEGDAVAALRQTDGLTGGYLGASGSRGRTSQWQIAFYGLEAGLIRSHVSNWEALRLLVQSGVLRGSEPYHTGRQTPDLASLELDAPRSRPGLSYATRSEATAERAAAPAERAANAALLDALLRYQYGAPTGASIDTLLSPDARLCFADFVDQRGPRGMSVRRAAFANAFSAVRIEIRAMVVETGRAAARWELSCVHSGPYLGLPASGRPITVSGASYARIAEGRVIEWIDLVDALRLLRMLGALSALLPGCYPDQ